MVAPKKKLDKPIVIKKYANRRLYDTGRSSYVTLDDLCETIKEGYDFVVYDAKTGEDLTRSVLTQIIVDQESRGQNLLPVNFLRQLIGLYGGNTDTVVPNYLEYMMDLFSRNQENIKNQINTSFEASKQGMKSFEGFFPAVPTLEDVKRQNFAIMEKAMQMFSPFATIPGMPSMPPGAGMGAHGQSASSSPRGYGAASGHMNDKQAAAERIKALQHTMAEMEKELRRLSDQL